MPAAAVVDHFLNNQIWSDTLIVLMIDGTLLPTKLIDEDEDEG
jgi:hypothetical protein